MISTLSNYIGENSINLNAQYTNYTNLLLVGRGVKDSFVLYRPKTITAFMQLSDK